MRGLRSCNDYSKFIKERMYCPVCAMKSYEDSDEFSIMCGNSHLWVHGTSEKLYVLQVLAYYVKCLCVQGAG